MSDEVSTNFLTETQLDTLEQVIGDVDIIFLRLLHSQYGGRVIDQIVKGIEDIRENHDLTFKLKEEELLELVNLGLEVEEVAGYFGYTGSLSSDHTKSPSQEPFFKPKNRRFRTPLEKQFSHRPSKRGVYSNREITYGKREAPQIGRFSKTPNKILVWYSNGKYLKINRRQLKKVSQLLRDLNNGKPLNVSKEKLEDVRNFQGSIFPNRSFYYNFLIDVGTAMTKGDVIIKLNYKIGVPSGYEVKPIKR